MINHRSAVAVLWNLSRDPQYARVSGLIHFNELPEGGTRISGAIVGLPPGRVTERGLHIHQSGDITNGCESMGEHYNPFNKLHGPRVIHSRTNYERHVGDLANIIFDVNGNAEFDFVDYLVELNGPHSVIGRGIILHENRDDLGQGSMTGNSGERIACGIIGLR